MERNTARYSTLLFLGIVLSTACSDEFSSIEEVADIEEMSSVEDVDINGEIPGDEDMTEALPASCQKGAVEMSVSPGKDMIVCDDPNDRTCERRVESLCPAGWQLCTQPQHHNRNEGWDYAVDLERVVVGEIYCRDNGGAGHYSLGPYDDPGTLATDIPFNCGYGSSRQSCTANYGCNEKFVEALCCAPTPTCGNGVVDSIEEHCDDGNDDETDDCLNNCTWRVPELHGVTGPGCWG